MENKIEAIDRAEAFRYMGLHGEPNAAALADIERCESLLLENAKPRYVWRVFGVEREAGELRLSGCEFTLDGESIARHLEGCEKAAVIAVTLSADTDRLLKKLALADGFCGLAADALASAYVEQVQELARKETAGESGFYCTWTFAPGYGDLPLETAKSLIECVDASRRIGLSVTASGMFTPQKSIVSLAGLSESEPDAPRRSCGDCNMGERCQFRKNGGHCK